MKIHSERTDSSRFIKCVREDICVGTEDKHRSQKSQ